MKLIDKILKKQVVIGVIGLGYVGLPLAQAFLRVGHTVIGYDKAYDKVKGHNFTTVHNLSSLDICDVIIICVGTPITKHKEPDTSAIVTVTKQIAKGMTSDTLVVLECSSYPGTTEEVVLPILEKDDLEVGEDFYLGYSPERTDIGNKDYTVNNTPKVVSGVTDDCRRLTSVLYETITSTVPVSSTKTAEMAKMLENTFRFVNISLINEMKVLAMKMGIDMFEVVEATKTRPFGYMPFYPGPGIGGDCVPVDPFYLAWKGKEVGSPMQMIERAGQINDLMPWFVTHRISVALNSVGKPLKDSRVMVLGLTYKKDVSDDRNSVSYKILDMLQESGAEHFCHDPYVTPEKYNFVDCNSMILDSMDIVVILVDHSTYDYDKIANASALVVDTRNCVDPKRKNVFVA
jgi:UDP-N-acetyl-D-glucosamine dehydrogenase